MKMLVYVFLLLSISFSSTNAATKYSHGNPTNEEQFILELINRARANPQEEAQRVINYPDSYVQSEIVKIGKSLIIQQFSTYPKRPPLAFNAQINVAARVHSQDMSDKNYQDHTGSDGSDPFVRMNKAGYSGWSGAGENIFAASQGPEYAHISFLVDWGADNQAKLGHRQNILNFTGTIFTEIGISGLVAPYKSSTGPYVVTEDFGLKTDRFVLGVIYNDKNGNKFYDPGEGIPNVLITLSGGSYEALTSSSGGYAIPINGLGGSITIKAEGDGLGGIITQNFSAGSENVKVDFTSSLSGAVSLDAPKDLSSIDSTNIPFNWYKSNKATSYLFELSDDQAFNTTILSHVVSDTTITPDYKLYINGTNYFWRVRGKSNKGDGEYSKISTFKLFIAPKSPVLIEPADYSIVKTTSVKFIWNKSNGNIKNYKFELWEQFGDNPIVLDSTLIDTFKLVSKLQYNITYLWKVTAKGQDFWGDISAEYKFDILDIPAKIILSFPQDNYSSNSKSIKFDWIAPSSGTVTKYKIEIAKNSKFSTMFLIDSVIKFTNRTVNNIPLGTYNWRITAGNDNGWGITGDSRAFTITNTSVEFDKNDNELIVYPNPTNSNVYINNLNSELIIYSISIVDMFGNKLFEKQITNDKINIDFSTYCQGQYMLMLKTNKDTILKKVTLIK